MKNPVKTCVEFFLNDFSNPNSQSFEIYFQFEGEHISQMLNDMNLRADIFIKRMKMHIGIEDYKKIRKSLMAGKLSCNISAIWDDAYSSADFNVDFDKDFEVVRVCDCDRF